uniref:Cyanobacterial TRADD-N associated 2 transmembrane domain-containing protein n=1 Tax=Tolypothrix bouteillei VB521301 TaxID=1479485 RepID=A0A0C1QWV9_9CYAN
MKLRIFEERLRQARNSFNLSLITATVSVFITLTGAGLLLSNKASDGAVTSACGLVASVRCIQIAKDANNRLDKILADLDDET